jgi:hypothetical protein
MLAMVSFLWISMFSLFYHTSDMGSDGMASSCLFGGEKVSLCTMSFSEIISLWQGSFVGLAQETGSLSSVLLLIILAVAIVFVRNLLYEFSERIFSRRILYIKQHFQINFFNYLKEAFSQGTLNPKVYELAIV